MPEDILEGSPDSYFSELKNLAFERPPKVLLDCSQLHQVVSGHINILWQSRSICKEAGVPIYLTNPGGNLIRVLRILDLLELFEFSGAINAFDEETIKTELLNIEDTGLNLEFKCRKSEIIKSRDCLRDYLKDMNLSSAIIYDLETLFYEVVNNIAEHSDLNENQTIKFEALCKDDRIVLNFFDNGRPFNPTHLNFKYDPANATFENKKRGYGLIMINRMSDKISYHREENGLNVLTLEKRWR